MLVILESLCGLAELVGGWMELHHYWEQDC